MDVRLQNPELKCMESENYKKYFRILCWSGTRFDKKPRKKFNKKDRLRRLKTANALAVCYAPALLGNPSQFAVYATVRKSILSRCRQLQTLNNEYSDESDGDDPSVSGTISKIPKITTIGLKTVFTLVSQARLTDQQLCGLSLKALLDVLQGHAPEDLVLESNEVISNLHGMLVEISSGNNPNGRDETPTNLTAISSSCLMALSVARGEAELILNAVTSLIMVKSSFTEQYVQIPVNLTMLQRSVQSVILGPSAHNIWLNYGVPHKSLVTSFPVDLPPHLTAGPGELVVRSLASDGCYLYVYTSKGLIKIGSGYGSSIRQHIYLYQSDFFASDRHGWLGYCKNKLYVRIGRKKTEVYEVEKDMLVVKCVLRLDPGEPAPAEPKSAVFTDGNQLGLILLTNFDNLSIKMYDVETNSAERTQGGTYTLTSRKEINVHLLRQRTLALGRAPFEDGLSRRTMDLDAPVAMQLDDNDDDPLMGISAGQDFGLLITSSGKVYYTGKGTSLGYKVAAPHTGKWTLMKETLFSKNEAPNVRKNRVVQVAVGHEGVHAILVLDSGSALFTGIARRGEDGDANKHRRTPKPTRPKKILKADGHFIVYAACNYGSTALVTRQGHLLMFGKDTQHCDSAGLVVGLMHEKVLKVALGKAHAVVLTNNGQVYTFGINNKGQCGREFGYTKEKPYPTRHQGEEARMCQGEHTWVVEYCRVCVSCNECTGFSTACHCANHPNRVPGEKCGCGEGDAGCSACGVCRLCADTSTSASRTEQVEFDGEVAGPSTAGPSGIEKTSTKYVQEEAHCSTSEPDRDSNVKVSCLPPARVMIPGGHKVAAVACGLHHTVLLTENGEVLAFGSNQYGALGAGDVVAHHRIVRVRVPRATAVAAGSNHTAVLTRDGELYTFGSYQKGSLGRPRIDEPRCERSAIWYATPSRVPRLGPRYACRAVWVSASGDQTFVQVSESLIKTDTLFSSTITANSNSIVILPNRPEHTFKCITINKNDGSCNAWTGPEQVDFVNSLACLDPLYDVLWCYQPQMRVMKCFNILAFDSHQLQRCCSNEPELFADSDYEYPNYGCMKRLEDFRHMESFEWVSNVDNRETENIALSNMSVLNQELAIPCTSGCQVTRIHAALHLIGCLDSLTYAHDNKLTLIECKRGNRRTSIGPMIEDFLTVNRFESHGGGWGYSGHSIEAIRFMCDTEILLGGFGLYGGRGDYSAKIKLYDIGIDGGDQEGDGELICESEEIAYECAPKDKFPILFETPISMKPHRWYVAWACINGPSSDCGSCGQAMVINDDIGFHFKTSKKSNNGTDVNAGQIPCLLYNLMGPDHVTPVRHYDPGEPVISLSKSISRKVTVACFRSLITLLNWSYDRFKEMLLKSNGQLPINYVKLTTMKHQKRLVYIIQACLRLVKSYINEIYPKNVGKRHCSEYMSYFDAIADVRNFIQGVMADQTPTCSMLPRRQGRSKAHRICYVQFALEMTNSILKEAHETIVSCFHAFFPTPTLKWNHLCFLLYHVKEGMVPARQIRELTSTCAAMCMSRNLCDVLQYVVPLTQSCVPPSDQRRVDNKIKDVPCKSATVPRASHSKPPPVPPRLNNRDIPKLPETGEARSSYLDWHLLDIIPKLLDIVLIPIKQHMMTRQCGQPHDHGEIKQRENLTESCCKFTVRLIAEMAYSAVHIQDDTDTKVVKHYVTPSRFMRVHQSRSWNTGNGSPDAIGFSVDRPGVFLLGACVYGGMGNFDYTLEVLQDVRMNHYLLPGANDDQNPANCWMSLESIQGSFAAADCQHDMIQIKFERPIVLKENVRYAIRFCNQGGRTLNGDCGLPSVKGVDGTAFHFSSCPLSFNGTTLARGQIPSLIYYSTTKPLMISAENADSLMVALRDVTLRVASVITDRCVDLFCGLRNELTAEDLRRNAAVLQQSPAINTLLPFVIANLDGLDDSKSVIQLLDMVRMLLPHVAAMNLLVPSPEEITTTTTTHFYTWVESEHPYKQATVSNMRVLFPPQVSWIVLEMDPRSITAQPEDALTIYAVAGAPKHKCHCITENRVADPPFRKRLIQITSETGEAEELDESGSNAPCMQYNCTYVSVTPKLANIQSDWPQKSLLIPGNEVIFSLETASDYLNEFNKPDSDDANRFGYRCLCVGYEDASFAQQRHGLAALEMELVHMGAACASRLLAPDLDIPPLSYPIIMDVQMTSMSMGNGGPSGAGADVVDENEALLLSRGLYLSTAPTVHQVLEGLPLLRPKSTERQFLSDFVADAEDSAGGRLARWLAPFSHVEPSKCELRSPPTPVRLASRLNIPIIIRDQYGEIVASRALKVEITVQRLYEQRSRGDNVEEENTVPNLPYRPIIRDGMCFHAITVMKAFQNFSFEELRVASRRGVSFTDALLNSGRVPVDRFIVHPQPDGSYVATWLPVQPGTYIFSCAFDDQRGPNEVVVEVAECSRDELTMERMNPHLSGAVCNLKLFPGRNTAGLRVRSSPSLQADSLGIVLPGSYVSFVEEVVNKDGIWVRLSVDSAMSVAACGTSSVWCMQYHRQLDRTLLVPIDADGGHKDDDSADPEDEADMRLWTDDDTDTANNDLSAEDRQFPFSIQCDLGNESDGGVDMPYAYAEPSKRDRDSQDDSTPAPSPKRSPRRNNGNSDEWWPPLRHSSSDNLQDVNMLPETEIIESEAECQARGLAQASTQTSPDVNAQAATSSASLCPSTNMNENTSPKRSASAQGPSRNTYQRLSPPPPPPLPARTPTPSLTPKKHAVSPTQAECLRAVFAALLWHQGIVHDAIACAAFLKFHPQLTKAGARVVTRVAPHIVAQVRPQRHSVEVTSAGQYLHIHPSTLETLTRSGSEAYSSRSRKTELEIAIREEDPTHSADTTPTLSVVNVLPPALRAIVALWDALYDADQLNGATDKKEDIENNENVDPTPSVPTGGARKKTTLKLAKKSSTVNCELCGGASVPSPLAAHMRSTHPGCRSPTARGYDRTGTYRRVENSPSTSDAAPTACGQLAQDLIGVKIPATLAAFQLWYIYCEKCRETALNATSGNKKKTKIVDEMYSRDELVKPFVDHRTMKDNAFFLLDLAPLTNSEPVNVSPWNEVAGRGPPTPPGSVWQPAPPFQCLPAFGAAPKTCTSETARYHSLGRQQPVAAMDTSYELGETSGAYYPRVPRSVSMGQAGGRNLAHAAKPALMDFEPDQQDTLSGAGSTLLTQPSAALQKLVGCGECPSDGCPVSAFEPLNIDAETLMRSPVLTFVLGKRNLPSHQQKMEAAVRMNTVRQYGFEALNWLLRSTTQATCAHDVMWWFCNALDKYARMIPPAADEDNKEAANDSLRISAPTASVSAMCPGGRAARNARAAFHSLLGSVSALAPSLPPASPANLQAVRCWALHYTQNDRAFLHRSQVFSVISKILSHAEEGAYEDGMVGALQESYHSVVNKQNFLWNCPDVTGWCDVNVSSRQGMAGALIDGSTETFWESGDEDRNRAKWVQVSYPSGSPEDKPHTICVHVDNSRDTVNKTLLMSFLFSGGTNDMCHMQDIEVDPKSATWISYTLPRTSSTAVRVRCEVRGPEASVRIRQVRVFAAPMPLRGLAPVSASQALHTLAERDTLRVFRLLTSQVFGKLLEWEHSASDSGEDAAAEEATVDDTDLREHVVGILFAGHKLTTLQAQVMAHIVCAIGSEASRVRDDWETALLCAEAERSRVNGEPRALAHVEVAPRGSDDTPVQAPDDIIPRPQATHLQDNFCFEMLSLLLALSGSAVGRVHLAQRTELLGDLLALLHTGSERVQRQVISLLRRMIAEIPPQKMLIALNYGADLSTRVTLLDHLVCYLGKAITVQMKVKGAGTASPGTVMMGTSVAPSLPGAWFMRGVTTKKHSHLVAKLLSDMAENKVTEAWGAETRSALAQYVCAVVQIDESERRPSRCVAAPAVWLALAALCVCEHEYVESGNGDGQDRGRDAGADTRPFCANHDDDITVALVECRTCGPLCAECDRFLHLNRVARTHQRQICKEEERAIRIDIHEGCGRAKLFWLLLLVDRRTLKALIEFRGMETGVGGEPSDSSPSAMTGLVGRCRFCGTRGNTGLLAIGNVCAEQQCQDYNNEACQRLLSCGHACGGVRGERSCLTCLFGCAGPESLRQDADDMCMICFTDPLQAAPAIQLGCGHIFHMHCCKKVLANKWNGPRITFSFSQCPICKENISHWTLEELLAPIRLLREEVQKKALMRMEYEGLSMGARAKSLLDPATYAMERYAYYVCHKCGKAYFGGLARCEAESNGHWEPSELVCGACSDVTGAHICPKHGVDFLEYKCRYCCSVAVFFCFGTSHFCNACHDDFQRVTNIPRHLLPHCPAGPKSEQLPGTADECPLHVLHPSTGEEFALGCGVCRHAHAF